MASQVTLPLWLALLISALAIWAAFERIIVPGVRWFLRRRFNRSIDELNTRLKLRIQPFKLARRQALIDQLIFDPEVLRAVEEYAAANKVSREAAQARARAYAREIVPSFSAYAYFGIGTRLARWVSTFLYRVRLGYMDEEAMTSVDPDAAVIFVINHRSNMDYVLVTYMAATSSALSYAVGEWARVWLLQNLIRSMGAYFVRRDSREPLYRKVLSRYVHLAVAGGLAQAMFPEGGLTRDGKLRPPKLGLLSYMVSGFDPKGPRDAVFVPVGINYDRVLEDRCAARRADHPEGEKPRFKFSPGRADRDFYGKIVSCVSRVACIATATPA
jgi:glycerol-3-phosphate O-acyltransferase